MKKFILIGLFFIAPNAFADHHAGGMFEKCDSNKDGKISKKEFLDKKSEGFKKTDKNSDGFLSMDEHASMAKDWKEKKKKKQDK